MDSPDNKDDGLLLIYKLVPREDGQVQVTLSMAHRNFLRYMGERGGEVRMDWDAAERMRSTPPHLRRETVRAHMGKLVEMGLVAEIAIVNSNHSFLRLTDMGRNILTQLTGQ